MTEDRRPSKMCTCENRKPFEQRRQRLCGAMFLDCFPCNPLPFSIGLTDGVHQYGSDWIKSDEAKSLLWLLMAQAYGQLARIDLCDEWARLDKLLNPEFIDNTSNQEATS